MDALTLATAFKNLWYKTSDIIWKYLEMEGKKNAAHFFIRIITCYLINLAFSG